MHFPKLPDWLVYAAAVSALLVVAVGRQERSDAPAPPPPVPGEEGLPLGPASPFDPSIVVQVPDKAEPGFMVSPVLYGLNATHFGHLQIHQYQIKAMLLHLGQRQSSIVGNADFVAKLVEQMYGQFLIYRVVFRQQDIQLSRLLHQGLWRSPYW